MKLKTNSGFPPGGYLFQDPRTPAAKWTDAHTSLKERIDQVIKFRRANPEIYPPTDGKLFDFLSVGEEVTMYNCQRLGFDPHWCYDEKVSQVNIPRSTIVAENKTCPACGAPLVPRYCPTCSGHKIIGWNCPACKKTF